MLKVDLRETRDKYQAGLYKETEIYYFIICIAVESKRFYAGNVFDLSPTEELPMKLNIRGNLKKKNCLNV